MDGSVGSADLSTWVKGKLAKAGTPGPRDRLAPGTQGVVGPQGPQGPAGPKGGDGKDGKDGNDGLLGAYYATAAYNGGDTNAGAIAGVACRARSDVAISGGVQVLGLDAGANDRNTPVSSSFPGRMDWSTNSPKVDRLDGWIVQFGGNAGEVSDKAPEKVKVWASACPARAFRSCRRTASPEPRGQQPDPLRRAGLLLLPDPEEISSGLRPTRGRDMPGIRSVPACPDPSTAPGVAGSRGAGGGRGTPRTRSFLASALPVISALRLLRRQAPAELAEGVGFEPTMTLPP